MKRKTTSVSLRVGVLNIIRGEFFFFSGYKKVERSKDNKLEKCRDEEKGILEKRNKNHLQVAFI